MSKQVRGAAEEPVQVISTEQCDSNVPLRDHASRDKKCSSSRSRSEKVHHSSGLGQASPSVIRIESRPIVSEENQLMESVEQAPQ